MVRDGEPERDKRDGAAKSWRKLCREQVAKEVMNHKGTPMAEHWKLVVIDNPAVSLFEGLSQRRPNWRGVSREACLQGWGLQN